MDGEEVLDTYKCWECEEYFTEVAPVEFEDPTEYICLSCWEGMHANRMSDLYDDNDDELIIDELTEQEDD